MGASTRPVVAELGDDSGWHFYSQRNTDNSITFAVNGQVSPLIIVILTRATH